MDVGKPCYRLRTDNEILDAQIKALEARIDEPFDGYINPIALQIHTLKELRDND